MPASIFIELTDEERKEFHRQCRSGKTAVRVKERLSIMLLADEGLTNTEIAEHVPLSVLRPLEIGFLTLICVALDMRWRRNKSHC